VVNIFDDSTRYWHRKNNNDTSFSVANLDRDRVKSAKPCRDLLYLHVLHAIYQTSIWKYSLQTHPDVPNPVGFGLTREVDNGNLIIRMSTPPALDIVWNSYPACDHAPAYVLQSH